MFMEKEDKLREFIREHCNDDVRKLALKASSLLGGADAATVSFAMDQISGRQKARTKLPSWAVVDGLTYPPHLSMEQCSSEQTAIYKKDVLKRYINADTSTLIDLTGGFGVDFSFLAKGFRRCVYVERLPHLCDIAAHNMPLLGIGNAEIVNAEHYDIDTHKDENIAVFIDPARRDSHGGRTYAIADCEPNIIGFIDHLLHITEVVMVKLSPMLDWHATVADINRAVEGNDAVREVHIVSTGNECKELLLVLSIKRNDPLRIVCVNDGDTFSFLAEASCNNNADGCSNDCSNNADECSSNAASYLLVPNASVMKAGCFSHIEAAFGVKQIASSSHLFLSNTPIRDFPGRQFRINAVTTMNKKELRTALSGINSANISCRNFPLKPEELRKRLKIKDGGSNYIFATTTSQGIHVLYISSPLT